MVKLVDTLPLRGSGQCGHAGSTPAWGTITSIHLPPWKKFLRTAGDDGPWTASVGVIFIQILFASPACEGRRCF